MLNCLENLGSGHWNFINGYALSKLAGEFLLRRALWADSSLRSPHETCRRPRMSADTKEVTRATVGHFLRDDLVLRIRYVDLAAHHDLR